MSRSRKKHFRSSHACCKHDSIKEWKTFSRRSVRHHNSQLMSKSVDDIDDLLFWLKYNHGGIDEWLSPMDGYWRDSIKHLKETEELWWHYICK